MKIALLVLLIFTITLISCKEKNDSYPYTAIVFEESNNDCKKPSIKILTGLDEVRTMIDTSYDGNTFIAANLPSELIELNKQIELDIRKPLYSELGACTALGISYPWLYVINAKGK